MHYQLCLQPLMERFESLDRSALLSISGNRPNVVLGKNGDLKTIPLLLLDEYEGYVGSKTLGLFASDGLNDKSE